MAKQARSKDMTINDYCERYGIGLYGDAIDRSDPLTKEAVKDYAWRYADDIRIQDSKLLREVLYTLMWAYESDHPDAEDIATEAIACARYIETGRLGGYDVSWWHGQASGRLEGI